MSEKVQYIQTKVAVDKFTSDTKNQAMEIFKIAVKELMRNPVEIKNKDNELDRLCSNLILFLGQVDKFQIEFT